MKNIVCAFESKKQEMLSKHPDQEELTQILFGEITDMFLEDFDAIERKKKRLNIIFSCIIRVLEKIEEQNVKKKYAIDVLGIFLEKDIVAYLKKILAENVDSCVFAIKAAQSELSVSQWSDPTSNHWQRAINRFR